VVRARLAAAAWPLAARISVPDARTRECYRLAGVHRRRVRRRSWSARRPWRIAGADRPPGCYASL